MSTQSHHNTASSNNNGGGGGGHQHNNGTNEPMKSSSGHHQQYQQTNNGQQQPNVRHIPIYVEGRDEPLVNKSNDHNKMSGNDGNESYNNYHQQQQQQHKQFHQQPQQQQHTRDSSPKPSSIGGSLFDRVKNFPTINIKNQASQQRRSDSPNRTTIPINVQHSNQQPQQQQQQQPQQQPQQQQQQQRPNTAPAAHSAAMRQSLSSIQKIQNIQKDVLELMDHVEKFTGSSRKDKQYLYLDEMLTQNLLKLDTIDADGQENIKQARREAIKCINKCIAVLEAKADSGNQCQNEQQHQDVPNYVSGKNSDQNISENSNK